MVSLSDREVSADIIESCRRGDREAFRALYQAYKDRVYSISLYFFHGDAATASDVTQQVFLKLITSIAQFRGDSGFSTWLYRLVVNTCLDGARQAKSQAESVAHSRHEFPVESKSHEEDFARAQIATSVQAAVSALPPKFRLPILLRYFDELSYEEMAHALNCSMGTVASRLNRGHKILAQKLASLRGFLSPGLARRMTMFQKHISRHLAAYEDRQLSAPKARRADTHLAGCERCRSELDQFRFAAAMMEHLPVTEAPESIWISVEAAIDRQPERASRFQVRYWRFAAAVVLALMMFGAAAYWYATRSQPHWEVTRLDGLPAVGSKHIQATGRIQPGEWLETDAFSRARIKIGQIGQVEVEPNTRLRLVAARPAEHRLALARGEISASISAPPRLFFVETSSSTAVDLGCAYTMQVDDTGFGLLRVTAGWVSLEWRGRESLVPAGANCHTRPGTGPGTPYFEDAPVRLVKALESFDFESAGSRALDTILAESRVRDTLTLWHLLSRVDAGERPRVYDRIAALAPLPSGVSREKALQLDPETLKRWKDELAWTW